MAKQPKGLTLEQVAPKKSVDANISAQPPYPSSRYFQVHFEHLHATLQELRSEFQRLNERLERIEKRLAKEAKGAGAPCPAKTDPRLDISPVR